MAKFNPSYAKHCDYKTVAASKTTGTNNVSTPGDGVPGNHYLERVLVIAQTNASPGACAVLDGDTVIVTHNAGTSGYLGNNIFTYEVGVFATSTKGFNITTGTSVSALAIGRFGG